MKDYFLLQYVLIRRRISEQGIHPVLGILLIAVASVVITEFLFSKTEFAGYVLVLTTLFFLVRASERRKNDFLRSVFGDRAHRKIRITENLLLVIPFSALLAYHHEFVESGSILVAAIVLANFSFTASQNFTLPTPYGKKPFEFVVGFRKTAYLFPLVYALTVISVAVDNLNLGLFSILLIYLVVLTFYTKPEDEFFVWSYATTPRRFLLEKIKTAVHYSVLTSLPACVLLLVFYPGEWMLILASSLAGLAFLCTLILAKYSAYPDELNLPEYFLIAFCLYFPPLLLALIPFFYTKSIQKLNLLLK